jgi:major capsid protein E
MLNIFDNDVFSVASLTARVNKVPFVPGQLGASGLFEEDGVPVLVIAVEEMNGTLALVAPSARGGPGDVTDNDKRKVRDFRIQHYQRDDSVMADEVQGVRPFGTDGDPVDGDLATVQSVVDRKSAKHARALDATLEHQRVGAIKGVVTDKNGNTIYDLYSQFGLSAPAAIAFHLDVTTTKVRQVCFDVIDAIENALDGVPYTGVKGYCGKNFWKSLVDHDNVRATYLNQIQAAELRGSIHTYNFEYGGINFERYRTGTQATASNSAGLFIGDDEVRFVPTGVPELFITRFGPADYEETVNTIGLPRYAKQFAMPNGKGRSLEVQMNAISLCTRPEALQSGVTAS